MASLPMGHGCLIYPKFFGEFGLIQTESLTKCQHLVFAEIFCCHLQDHVVQSNIDERKKQVVRGG